MNLISTQLTVACSYAVDSNKHREHYHCHCHCHMEIYHAHYYFEHNALFNKSILSTRTAKQGYKLPNNLGDNYQHLYIEVYYYM